MLLSCMEGFASHPAVLRFCFTGGEPFLYLKEIKAALLDARARGVRQPFHIVTSAYWAKDIDQVRAELAALKSLGMDMIAVSYDHEHAKWVTPEQVRMVAEAVRSLELNVHISGVFWDTKESVADLVPDLVTTDGIKISEYLVAPVGRAKQSAQWPRRYDTDPAFKESCGKPGLYSVSIYPDGELYPCCSGGFNREGKLSAGNVNHNTPAALLNKVFTNFHVRMAKEFGWRVLYDLVERETPELVPDLPRFEDADSACEICRDLNVGLADKLAPIYALIEAEYAVARARRELDRKGLSSAMDNRFLFDDDLVNQAELLDRLRQDNSARLSYLAGEKTIRVAEFG